MKMSYHAIVLSSYYLSKIESTIAPCTDAVIRIGGWVGMVKHEEIQSNLGEKGSKRKSHALNMELVSYVLMSAFKPQPMLRFLCREAGCS